MDIARACFDAHGRVKHAGQRPQQQYNSQQWERAVGGTRNAVLAIYGSKDSAKLDHRNDALCLIVDNNTGIRNGVSYIPNTTGRHTDVITTPPVDVEHLIQRAIARGMTLVDYCALIGQEVY